MDGIGQKSNIFYIEILLYKTIVSFTAEHADDNGFTLIDGNWDIQLWVDSAKPVNAKVYRLRIKVPAELVGEAAAEAMVGSFR